MVVCSVLYWVSEQGHQLYVALEPETVDTNDATNITRYLQLGVGHITARHAAAAEAEETLEGSIAAWLNGLVGVEEVAVLGAGSWGTLERTRSSG
jgi:hypothetical protein